MHNMLLISLTCLCSVDQHYWTLEFACLGYHAKSDSGSGANKVSSLESDGICMEDSVYRKKNSMTLWVLAADRLQYLDNVFTCQSTVLFIAGNADDMFLRNMDNFLFLAETQLLAYPLYSMTFHHLGCMCSDFSCCPSVWAYLTLFFTTMAFL